MKTTVLCSLLLAGFGSITTAAAQNYFWNSGRKIPLTVDSSRFVLETTAASIAPAQVEEVKRSWGAKSKVYPGNQPNRLYIIAEAPGKLSAGERAGRKAALPAGVAHYGYKLLSGSLLTPTGDVNFKVKPGVAYEALMKRIRSKVTLVSSTSYQSYLVRPADPTQFLAVANQIYETGLVEWSQPDFYSNCHSASDPLYPQQYYLNNTGQTGGTADIDINAPEAWCLTKGNSAIRVAVIDDGVESHEDLGPLAPGYDPLTFWAGAPVGRTNSHGQACAGIIGAQHNSVGAAGIAPNVQIVPVNIAYDGDVPYSDSQFAQAFTWAKSNADVISFSWVFPDSTVYNSNHPIAAAISDALHNGRGGKGCVMVSSAGNDNNWGFGVEFPANLSGVIAVGAIDRDGVVTDYSCRGRSLALVAPSGKGLIFDRDVVTLDRMDDAAGPRGYGAGNYISDFTGTSAACPQVAAVAALVLSVNPNLNLSQVRTALTSTATHMGPGALRNNDYGYGRVNAYAAVSNVLASLYANFSINGPSNFCAGPMQYTASSQPTGTTLSWTSSDPGVASINPAGVATVTGSGSVVFTATLLDNCGQALATATKQAWVNAYPPYPIVSMTQSGCFSQIECHIDNFDPNFTYTVNRIARVTALPSQPTSAGFILKTSGGNTTGTFSITARNPCNSLTTTTEPIDVEFICDTYQTARASTAYPNPAAEILLLPAGTEAATLVNDKGRVVQTASAASQLQVGNLPEGLYNLQMRQNGKLINQRIQIKH